MVSRLFEGNERGQPRAGACGYSLRVPRPSQDGLRAADATDELQSTADPELLEDPRDVSGHGAAADPELVGDRLVRGTAADEAGDLQLSGRQSDAAEGIGNRLEPVADLHDGRGAESDVAGSVHDGHLDTGTVDEGAIGGAEVDDRDAVVDPSHELGMAARQAAAGQRQVALGVPPEDDGTLSDVDAAVRGDVEHERNAARDRDTSVHRTDRRAAITTRHGSNVAATARTCQAPRLQRGDELDRYIVLEPIGAGGGGEVYRAYDPDLERPVAVKVLRGARAADGRAWLLQEARALAKVSHAHVVTVHDVGEARGEVFIAMELLQGSTLAEWLRRERPTFAALLRAFDQAAAGLQAIHDAGLLHRDVKPSNMVMSHSGRLALVDFGLAAGSSAYDGDVSQRSGTPHYFAPELRGGAAPSPVSDLYALCLTFFEALDVPGIRGPAWFRAAMRRGMADDPARRPTDVAALRERVRGRARRGRALRIGALASAALAGLLVPRMLAPTPDEVARTERQTRSQALRDGAGWAHAVATWQKQDPERAQRVTAGMAAFEDEWSRVLAAQIERERSGPVDDRTAASRRCLDRAWVGYEATVRFGLEDPARHDEIADALGGVADPSRCADDADPAVNLPRPTDPERAAAVDAARDQIDALILRLQYVAPEEVARDLDALAPAVDELDFDPLRAELDSQRATTYQQAGADAEAATLAERAVLTAAKSGHLLAAARSTGTLVLSLSELGRLDSAEAWAKRGLADTAFVRGLDKERLGILRASALVARRQGDLDTAERWLLEGLALLATDDDDPVTGPELYDELANLRAERGEAGPAIDAAYEAVARLESDVGPMGQAALASTVNLGRIALRVGHDSLAADVLEDAVARYDELPPTGYQWQARMLLGAARRRTGDLDGAREVLSTVWDEATDDDPMTHLIRSKVALELAFLAGEDSSASVRDEWFRAALDQAHRMGSEPALVQTLTRALEWLLDRGACGPARALADPRSREIDDERLSIARTRLDVACKGTPAAADD